MTAKVTLKFTSGGHIRGACQEAIRIAQKLDQSVSFRFNGVNMKITPDDNFFERMTYYDKALAEEPNDDHA